MAFSRFPRSKNPRAPWNGWNKWGGGFRRKRPRLPLRALSSKVARKRSEWGWIYNDFGTWDGEALYCGIRCVEWGEWCNDGTPLRIPIVTSGALAAAFDDTVTIAKMVGRILWRPHTTVVNPCSVEGFTDTIERAQQLGYPTHLRAYLKKSDVPSALGGFPTDIDPMNAEDWTDRTGVLKEWNHIWLPDARLSTHWYTPYSIVGVCSDTTRAAYLTPATASGSQPAFNVPEIETNCSVVGPGEGCTVHNVQYDVREHKWWAMNLNRSRPIDLKEDDDLSIFVNWSQPRLYDAGGCASIADCNPQSTGSQPCSMQFALQLKVLYQYG